ncbi:Hypothetical predicted protein [Podarcis lilfordi]|uniref:L1 transposable element RRM domain-containing protein n=1 Tax=Podarcis lilfordi TaxID=74358 RepID=A0AA35JQR7_9SAUR|nr:Hypothetical predicted protein [Podarcis lilfordi]
MSHAIKKQMTGTGSQQQQLRRNSGLEEMDLKELIISLKLDVGGLRRELEEKINTIDGKLEKLENTMKNNEKENEEIKEKLTEALEGMKETDKKVQEIKNKNQQMEEMVKKISKEQREQRKEMDKSKKEMEEQKAIQEATGDALAMIQMQIKEKTLRFRNVPEEEKEDIWKMTETLAKWLHLQEKDIIEQTEKIFRVNSRKVKMNKWPADCIIVFTSNWMKDKILQAKSKNKLTIDGKEIIILQEVPPRLIKKRQQFQFLTKALKAKSISFRWEYPVGISFNFKGKRR